MSSAIVTANPVSYTLDDLINARLKADQEAAEKEAAARTARRQSNQAEAIQRLQQRLDACLTPNLLVVMPAISYTVEFSDKNDQVENVYAVFDLYGHTWRLSDLRQWKIRIGSHLWRYVNDHDLEHALLRAFALVRDGQLNPDAPTPDGEGDDTLS